jgi:eukaryotic-like serine/threonine-protein kinase
LPERFIGQTLGKFRVDALLGTGGFAWVYRAYDPELEIPVALKVLKPHYAGDERFESRFRREASTAARLRHPNIVKIYAIGKHNDAVYFAMDFLPQSLSGRLDVMTIMPETLLLRMGIDVASALAFAHREGVIHRDIKPDNILFDDHGNAVVADFGIARALWGYVKQTGTNMVVGTPQYFAPEQARGQELDGRADLYALGVTLFRASTGQLPFQGDDWYEIARQHVEEAPPQPRSLNPKMSRELERVILKLLAKDQDQRYATGDEVSAVLGSLLQHHEAGMSPPLRGLPPHVTDPSMAVVAQTARWRRQSLARRGAIGAGAALIVLGGAGTAWWLGKRSGENAPVAVDSSAAAVSTDSAALKPESATVVAATPTPSRPDSVQLSALAVRLKVKATPATASLFVDGREVGVGEWSTDTIAFGSHVVAASVKSIPGCTAARQEKTVEISATSPGNVTLTPRGCGTLLLEARPGVTGTFTVTSSSNGERPRQGALPLDKPLVLPVGVYRLTVEADGYEPFNGSVQINAGEPLRKPLLLLKRS